MPSADDLIQAGFEALAALDYETAFRSFERAAKADGSRAIAHYGMAEAALGLPKVASESIHGWYKKALELEPSNPETLEGFAMFCMDVGRFNEAEQALNRAAEVDPDNAGTYRAQFAIQYRAKAPAAMAEFLDDTTRDMIARKALSYALQSLGMSEDEARRLLR